MNTKIIKKDSKINLFRFLATNRAKEGRGDDNSGA
jgi:hypothetical protein